MVTQCEKAVRQFIGWEVGDTILPATEATLLALGASEAKARFSTWHEYEPVWWRRWWAVTRYYVRRQFKTTSDPRRTKLQVHVTYVDQKLGIIGKTAVRLET